MADWSALPAGMETQIALDHVVADDALAERLKDSHIVMGMRERTAFPRSVRERLPELRLLITTGRRNASFDVDAAT